MPLIFDGEQSQRAASVVTRYACMGLPKLEGLQKQIEGGLRWPFVRSVGALVRNPWELESAVRDPYLLL
jgi:hypothetical protein